MHPSLCRRNMSVKKVCSHQVVRATPCSVSEAATYLGKSLTQRGLPSEAAANLLRVLECLGGSQVGLPVGAAVEHAEGGAAKTSSRRGLANEEKEPKTSKKSKRDKSGAKDDINSENGHTGGSSMVQELSQANKGEKEDKKKRKREKQ